MLPFTWERDLGLAFCLDNTGKGIIGMKDLGIVEKVQSAIDSCEYDAVVAVAPDNAQYLSGASLPFLYHYEDRKMIVLWPKTGTPICLCPAEWASSVQNLSWIKNIQGYEGQDLGSLAKALIHLIKRELGDGAQLGIDMNRAPRAFSQELQQALGNVTLKPCDDWLRRLRIIKTPGEVELLEDVAYSTDHAIVAAAHHILLDTSGQSKSEVGYRHEIIVHSMERYIDLIGHHSIAQVLSADNSRKFWSMFSKPWLPDTGTGWRRSMMEGDLLRAEMRASKNGYWSDAARILTIGEAPPDQRKAYHDLVALKGTAIELIRPGTKCSQVFKAVVQDAEDKEIDLLAKLGIGHGIGVTAYEPPYLLESDDTKLEPGMVLGLDPIVYGPAKEILRSKDTILITETGCKLFGSYLDWSEPHIPPHISPRSLTEIVRD